MPLPKLSRRGVVALFGRGLAAAPMALPEVNAKLAHIGYGIADMRVDTGAVPSSAIAGAADVATAPVKDSTLSLARKLFNRTQRRKYENRIRVNGLDPDLAVLHSTSQYHRLRIQRDRNAAERDADQSLFDKLWPSNEY